MRAPQREGAWTVSTSPEYEVPCDSMCVHSTDEGTEAPRGWDLLTWDHTVLRCQEGVNPCPQGSGVSSGLQGSGRDGVTCRIQNTDPRVGCIWVWISILLLLSMKIVAHCISKQRMLWPSSHQSLPNTLPFARLSATAATPQTVHPEGTQDEKNRTLALDSWDANQRNDFSEPRLLHLPIHRKALDSLTWDVWFSLINSNLLMFQLPGFFFCKNSFVSWLLPYLFRAVHLSDLRGCLLGLSPQKVSQIKHNSQILGSLFFLDTSSLSLSEFIC